MAYEKTKVDWARTMGEINKLIYAHGGEAFAHSEIPGQGFKVEFIKRVNGQRLLVRIPIALNIDPQASVARRDQEVRTKWRSLYYWLKAQYDAIDKGIMSFEQVFLADTVVHLPGGKDSRMIDVIRPGLASGREFDINKLLPGPTAVEEAIDATYEVSR